MRGTDGNSLKRASWSVFRIVVLFGCGTVPLRLNTMYSGPCSARSRM